MNICEKYNYKCKYWDDCNYEDDETNQDCPFLDKNVSIWPWLTKGE